MPGFSGSDARRDFASVLTTWTDEEEADMIDSSSLSCGFLSVSWVGPVESAAVRTLCVSGWAQKNVCWGFPAAAVRAKPEFWLSSGFAG
jgi:hypothetical protein